MASTYSNDLRLEEQAVGENSGTWGTKVNASFSQIADGFSFGTKAMSSDANETFTMPDGTADPTRSLYLKITSSATLTATRTITLGPNTVSKLWLVENATTGSQSIIIKQGTGATVTVASGGVRLIYTDGAGSGAAVVDALTNLGTSGTLTSGGVITANAGVVIDNITIDGTEIDLSSGDLTVDVAGDIILDAGGDNILIKDAGTHYANITMASNSLLIDAVISDGDLIFRGNDGGSTITALQLDMSAAGNAIFNGNIALADSKQLQMGADADFIIYHDGTSNYVQAAKQDSDIILRGNDGGSGVNMLTLDTSAAGLATFNAGANFGGNIGVGTSSAGNLIEVEGASPIVEINASSGSPELQFSDGGTDEFSIMYDTGANALKFVEGGVGTHVTILDGGNFGLGTTAPAYTLDVDSTIHIGNDGSSGYTHSRLIFDAGATTRGAGAFYHNQGDDVEYFAGSPYNKSDSWAITRNATASHADATADVTNALVVVDSSGNMGIGVSSPTQKLDVNGTVELNNLTVGGSQGTDGQVLTSTGSGVAWEDASGGGGGGGGGAWNVISSQTISSSVSSVTFTGVTGYKVYKLIMTDINHSSSGTADQIQLSSDNGSSFATFNISSIALRYNSGSTSQTISNDFYQSNKLPLMYSFNEYNNDEKHHVEVTIFGLNDSSFTYTHSRLLSSWGWNVNDIGANETYARTHGSGGLASFNAFKVDAMSGGTYDGGTFTLYGLAIS